RRIVFDFNVALNRYQIDGQWFPEAGGSLDDHYGGGVSFGFGDASINATAGGGGLPADPVTFAGNCFVINERGISDKRGYVYLQNRRGNAYACAVRDMAGSVQVKRWTGSAWWPRN
ncbi:MAG: hypothetical protein GY868_17850, partial [Deltaproteobacteria bacterium]|nr:hypothetical protein [Deltaproteobacteria bacterium]